MATNYLRIDAVKSEAHDLRLLKTNPTGSQSAILVRIIERVAQMRRAANTSLNTLFKAQMRMDKEIGKFKRLRQAYAKLERAGDTIQAFEDDLAALRVRMQLLHFKQTVITECTWLCGRFPGSTENVMIRILTAFDNTDSWWNARKDWTIDLWVSSAINNTLVEAYNPNRAGYRT